MRGRLIVGALTVVLAAGAGAWLVNANSREGDRVRTTQIVIKEAERDLVRRRMQTDHYPRVVQPEPVDGWGHPIVIDVPSPEGQPYRLVSYGADGLPGGRGPNADINNWEF